MKKAIILIRVSTSKQQLESQEITLRRIAKCDGYTDSNIILISNKESAVKLEEEERVGLNVLKQKIEEDSEIDCLYIWELSRLSRKPKDLYSIRDFLFKHHVQLKCSNPQFTMLKEDKSSFDNTANIIFSLFSALAEQEAIEKRERFARGKQIKAEQGKYAGGAIPFGYCICKEQDKRIIINEDEARIIRDIYNLYEKGYSQTKIAKEYIERGHNRFTLSLVHQILTNESYTGKKIRKANSSYPRSYPPIITQTQYDRCREIAKKNNTNLSKSKNIYYAEKLIKCQCGAHWIGVGSKAHYKCYDAYYPNPKTQNYKSKGCTNKSTISINVIDSLLWYVAQEAETEYWLQSATKDLKTYHEKISILHEKVNNTDNLLNNIEKRKQRLLEAYIDGLDKKRYEQKKEELALEERNIKYSIVSYKEEIEHLSELINSIKGNFNLNSEDKINEHIRDVSTIIEKISSITSDSQRYDIIHKHIKEVNITTTKIEYNFAIGCKKTTVKRISIILFNGIIHRYYFIPFDGKGGHMVVCNNQWEIISPIYIQYIDRYRDIAKNKQKTMKQID